MVVNPTPALSSSIAVGSECPAYQQMKEHWLLVDALRGGTYRMRCEAQRFLPKEELETDPAYLERLNRSFLFPGFDDAVRALAAKPFAKPVVLAGSETLAPALAMIEDDANNCGDSLSLFLHRVFDDALAHGISYILVDFPQRRAVTTDSDVASGVHPYFVHVKATDVIGWQSTRDPMTGREVLRSVRIREQRNEDDGEYGQKCVNYIREFNLAGWRLWREDDSQQGVRPYDMIESGEHDLGVVPLVAVQLRRTGFMMAESPLCGLAWLNVEHWQKQSDRNNSEHYALVPVLFQTGVAHDDSEKKLAIGSKRAVRTTKSPSEASLQWVESSGSALSIVAKSIESLEARMQKLGLEPMLEASAPRTAAEVGVAQEGRVTSLRQWVGILQDAAYNAFALASKYLVNAPLPDEFAVQVNTDWEIATSDAAGVDTILRMEAMGLVTPKRALIECRRRGLFGEDYDLEEELADLESGQMPQPPTQNELDALRAAREARTAQSA